MKKVKLFFDIEKEEKWLNEQLQKGWRCTNVSGIGVYTFEQTGKKQVMRLDYQDYVPKKKFEEYKGIYEDFGWNCIKGSRFGGIQYWQKDEDGQNEIFSDRQSKRGYYKRVMSYLASLALLALFASYMLYKDSGLYLTEGLWHMEGALFWKAFLFETPFVLFRLIPVFMALLFVSGFYKAYEKYTLLKEQ